MRRWVRRVVRLFVVRLFAVRLFVVVRFFLRAPPSAPPRVFRRWVRRRVPAERVFVALVFFLPDFRWAAPPSIEPPRFTWCRFRWVPAAAWLFFFAVFVPWRRLRAPPTTAPPSVMLDYCTRRLVYTADEKRSAFFSAGQKRISALSRGPASGFYGGRPPMSPRRQRLRRTGASRPCGRARRAWSCARRPSAFSHPLKGRCSTGSARSR
jgi:hypothetical protein